MSIMKSVAEMYNRVYNNPFFRSSLKDGRSNGK